MTDVFPSDEPRPQTSGQWAVRWHGLVFGALLAASVPLVHLGWHVGLGRAAPLVETRSQLPAPELRWATLANGTWMLAEERHLREASPVVWWLRGSWNELLFRAGVPQSDLVHVGADQWLFLAAEVHPDVRAFAAASPARRRLFGEVRDLVHRAGAELLVSIVPDKARVHSEHLAVDPAVVAAKAPLYGMVLQELAAEGVAAVDLARAMAVARAAAPDEPLYYRRDTHWLPTGALTAARAVAAAVEGLPLRTPLLPRRTFELGALTSVSMLGDLVPMLGLLGCEQDDGRGGRTAKPLSLLTTRLAESRDYYSVVERTPAGVVPLDGHDPAAEVVLLGTSFADENGARALSLALGRPVRGVVSMGAAGLRSLQEIKPELERGTRAKVVVWEIVERGLYEPGWVAPRL